MDDLTLHGYGTGKKLVGDAQPAHVLVGKTFSNADGNNKVGSMTNNGSITITPNQSNQTIPAGYHDGTGIVSAVTFDATKVLTDTTIASKAGTMPNKGAKTFTPSASVQSDTAGYYSSVACNAVTFDVSRVLTGTTIAGTAGTMTNRGTVNITPSTANQTIGAGYHSGAGVVYGSANLTAANIKSGVNIFGVVGILAPAPASYQVPILMHGTSFGSQPTINLFSACNGNPQLESNSSPLCYRIYSGNDIATTNLVDVTDVKKIWIDISEYTSGTFYAILSTVRVSTFATYNYRQTAMNIGSGYAKFVCIDTSAISGNYYIRLQTNGGSYYVHKVFLEY